MGLTDGVRKAALDAAWETGDTSEGALFAAVRLVRYRMIIAGEIDPFAGEVLPDEVEAQRRKGVLV